MPRSQFLHAPDVMHFCCTHTVSHSTQMYSVGISLIFGKKAFLRQARQLFSNRLFRLALCVFVFVTLAQPRPARVRGNVGVYTRWRRVDRAVCVNGLVHGTGTCDWIHGLAYMAHSGGGCDARCDEASGTKQGRRSDRCPRRNESRLGRWFHCGSVCGPASSIATSRETRRGAGARGVVALWSR